MTSRLTTSGVGVATGCVVPFAGGSVPAGWLPADGGQASRTTYAALFGVIGTTWGAGDGSTTFNLPDLRGRVPVGAGAGPGLTNRPLGSTGGEESHALTYAEVAAHAHSVVDVAHNHTLHDPTHNHQANYAVWQSAPGSSGSRNEPFGSVGGGTTNNPTGVTIDSAYSGVNSTGYAGSGAAHNTMPPFVGMTYIVKA